MIIRKTSYAVHIGQRLGPYEIVAASAPGGWAKYTRPAIPGWIGSSPSKYCRSISPPILIFGRALNEKPRPSPASINPHICALYDIGNQDGIDYLVMEYLEGETLAHRLKQGPLPVPNYWKRPGMLPAPLIRPIDNSSFTGTSSPAT